MRLDEWSRKMAAMPTVGIAGELFHLELRKRGRRRVYLWHPRWSLHGHGRTLPEAEMQMRHEADVVATVFERNPSPMDSDATDMLRYMQRVRLPAAPCRCDT